MAITPIQKFYDINTNPVTRKNYEFQLKKFWKWGKLDSDDFVKLDKSEREDKVKQYIQFFEDEN